jgi:hypothetical protein
MSVHEPYSTKQRLTCLQLYAGIADENPVPMSLSELAKDNEELYSQIRLASEAKIRER